MPTTQNLFLNDDGTIRVVDQDIIDVDRRKGEPKTIAEAGARYRLMQAEQLIRSLSPKH